MSDIQRSFIPGSQWVYIKLYTGEKTADEILIKVINPIVKELKKRKYIEKWFFIRYSDPDFHLRIRLLVYDIQHIGELLNLFYRKLCKLNNDNFIWKVQLDTYNRELERYGMDLIEEAESIFHVDSECILDIIKGIGFNENYRWMIALKLIDELLSDFCLTIEEKQKLMKELKVSFKSEFGFNEHNSKQLNFKFRENKKIIETVLSEVIDDNAFALLLKYINKRSKKMKPVVFKMRIKLKNETYMNELLKSYLHMMLNRLFRSKNRQHEMILYDFMFRYYTSEIVKKNIANK